jgi:hypothetical protein
LSTSPHLAATHLPPHATGTQAGSASSPFPVRFPCAYADACIPSFTDPRVIAFLSIYQLRPNLDEGESWMMCSVLAVSGCTSFSFTSSFLFPLSSSPSLPCVGTFLFPCPRFLPSSFIVHICSASYFFTNDNYLPSISPRLLSFVLLRSVGNCLLASQLHLRQRNTLTFSRNAYRISVVHRPPPLAPSPPRTFAGAPGRLVTVISAHRIPTDSPTDQLSAR